MTLKVRLVGYLCIVASLASLLFVPIASAAVTHFGRAEYVGFYSGTNYAWGDRVSPNGITLAGSTSQARANSLISQLRSWRNGSNVQLRVASAFIIDTMLGRDATGSGRTSSLSAGTMMSDLSELEARLNNFVATGGTIQLKTISYSINTYYQEYKSDPSNPRDVAWYSESGVAASYVFEKNGIRYYAIKQSCANPLGDTPGIPGVSSWSLVGYSRVSLSPAVASFNQTDITANVGDTVYWRHTLYNSGPSNMDIPVTYDIPKSGFSAASGWQTNSPTGTAQGTANSTFVVIDSTRPSPFSQYTSYVIKPEDQGKTLCAAIRWTPASKAEPTARSSKRACVEVGAPMNFGTVSKDLELQPNSNVVVDGQTVTANYMATSDASVPADVSWDAWMWYDTNNDGVRGAGDDIFYSQNGVGTVGVGANNQVLTTRAETADIQKGGRICAEWDINITTPGVALTPPTTSTIKCVYLGFNPTVQVWGNDIRVGSATDPVNNVASIARGTVSAVGGAISPEFTGSWSEYGVFAPYNPAAKASSVIGVASASGLAIGSPVGSLNQQNWSKMTFSNVAAGGCAYGCYSSPAGMGAIPNVEQYLTKYGLVGGKVLVKNGMHNITANIPDDGTGVPQIIIADNIRIDRDVTEVNAWLIARDTLDTCGPGGPPALVLGDCSKNLRINGPVIAKTLMLRRVGDVAVDKKLPGETINLRGDAYIWAYKTTHTSGAYRTIMTSELPPRY